MSWKDIFPRENIYFETENGILYNDDVLGTLRSLPNESIDCIITSPPYWGLRFYGNESNTIWGGDRNCNHEFNNEQIDINLSVSEKTGLKTGKNPSSKLKNLNGEYITGYCKKCGAWYGQLGLEPNFNQYLDNLLEIFKECKRVLKPSGTLFVNIADTYFSKCKGTGGKNSKLVKRKGVENFQSFPKIDLQNEYPEKSLCMIPERFAMRMIDELGFILRNKVIWHKPNVMPESIKDRFTKSYEFIYFFTKIKKYYFNQILETSLDMRYNGNRNKRDVWNIPTKPLKDPHFAPFPIDLPMNCIRAGCPEKELVLDIFIGSGTTALACEKLNRRWIGIEINPKYCEITKDRIKEETKQKKFTFKEV